MPWRSGQQPVLMVNPEISEIVGKAGTMLCVEEPSRRIRSRAGVSWASTRAGASPSKSMTITVRRAGEVERAVAAAKDSLGAQAEFILASQRDRVLRARLPIAAPAAAARPSAGKNVFLIHGLVAEDDLDDVELRVGYEGRARIRTQRKSLLRAAVDPFVDYVRMALF